MLPVVVDDDTLGWLIDNPSVELTIDVNLSTLLMPDGSTINYPIDRFARYCLVEGIDQLGYLQKRASRIQDYEEKRSWTP